MFKRRRVLPPPLSGAGAAQPADHAPEDGVENKENDPASNLLPPKAAGLRVPFKAPFKTPASSASAVQHGPPTVAPALSKPYVTTLPDTSDQLYASSAPAVPAAAPAEHSTGAAADEDEVAAFAAPAAASFKPAAVAVPASATRAAFRPVLMKPAAALLRPVPAAPPPSSTAKPEDSTRTDADATYHTVLYTKKELLNKKKAAKKFCDGILELPAGGVGAAAAAGACCLYDMDGKAVFRGKARKYVPPPAPGAGGFGGKRCKAASKEDEGDGEEEEDEEGGSSGRRYELGSWVAEVDRDVAPQDFRSGACFLKKGGRGGAADVLAAAAMRGGAAAVGMKLGATGGGRLAPPARPGLASTGAAATGAAAGGPKPAGRPLHDPSAAGAAVLNDCQWKGGAGMLAGGPRGGCGRPVVPVVLDPFLGRHMRPHQVEGIRFMYECVAGLREPGRFGCILADEMGLGKTAQTLSLIWTLLRQGPEGRPLVGKAIVACPATLVRNWGAEVRKWLGSERLQAVVLTQGPDAQQKIVDFKLGTVWRLLIGSYEALRKHASDLSGAADLLVCDEGHRLKAGQGNKTVDALMQLGCSRRVLLTGTPVQNNLSEFYALLSFVAPDLLGSPAVFKRLYGDPITASRDRAATAAQRELGASRAAELHAAVGRFVLRRTQALLTRHLPPLAVYVVFCRPSPLQVSLYRHVIASKAVTCLMYGGGEATEVAAATLSAITALRKLCNHPDLLLQGPNAGQDASASAGSAAAGGGSGGWLQGCPPFETGVVAHSGKLAALDALLASVITSSGERAVVVSTSTAALDLIASLLCGPRGYRVARIDGDTAVEERQAVVDNFNVRGIGHVFLLSTRAGGAGLNLTGASHLVLYDSDWNPAMDQQAMARIWRDGQTRRCQVYRLLTTGTIEERVYQRQLMKGDLADTTMALDAAGGGSGGGGGKQGRQFSRNELRQLFSLNVTADGGGGGGGGEDGGGEEGGGASAAADTCDTRQLLEATGAAGDASSHIAWLSRQSIRDNSYLAAAAGAGVVTAVSEMRREKPPGEAEQSAPAEAEAAGGADSGGGVQGADGVMEAVGEQDEEEEDEEEEEEEEEQGEDGGNDGMTDADDEDDDFEAPVAAVPEQQKQQQPAPLPAAAYASTSSAAAAGPSHASAPPSRSSCGGDGGAACAPHQQGLAGELADLEVDPEFWN